MHTGKQSKGANIYSSAQDCKHSAVMNIACINVNLLQPTKYLFLSTYSRSNLANKVQLNLNTSRTKPYEQNLCQVIVACNGI
jgi:hypothetical protein